MIRRGPLAAPPVFFSTLLVTLLMLGAAVPPATSQERTRSVASYRIEARLDAGRGLVHGIEVLTWTNTARVPVEVLWFHAYQNAFMNEASTASREGGGLRARRGRAGDLLGYTEIEAMTSENGTDLLPTLRWRHPDDANVHDRTVFTVRLPEAVPPGGRVRIRVDFHTRLPGFPGPRSGRWEEYHVVTQWYPKIGVLEPSGVRGAEAPRWNVHQFHADGEFYADFGHYEVEITVPERYVVGATGRRVSTFRNPATGDVTYRYEQGDVHDFAWVADPGFRRLRRVFEPQRELTAAERSAAAELLGVGADRLRLEPVEVTLLVPPVFEHDADRFFDATFAGLKWFGLWYGPYPYETLTVVVPSDGLTGGGMEYPTIFTTLDAYLLGFAPFRGIRLQEQVTVHELGHQYWYGMVASNEPEEAWLDEGINSYSTARVMERAYGTGLGRVAGLELGVGAVARAMYLTGPRTGGLLQPAWSYHLGGYTVNAYAKPELALRTLEGYLGERTVSRALRRYFRRWRFRHPATGDLLAAVQESCHCGLDPFWDQVVNGDAVADFGVASASSTPVRPPAGRFRRGDAWEVVERTAEAGPPDGYRSRVVVQRLGDLRWPVRVVLRFADGSEHLETWDGRSRTHLVETVSDAPLEQATVDPDGRLELDVNRLNDSRHLAEAEGAKRRAAIRWMDWMAQLLLAASGAL